MTRKRRVSYPPPRSSKGPAPAPVPIVTPPTVAVINMQAGAGKSIIEAGMRVTILGTGLYTGETAIVESLVGGVIPAAVVRTDAGEARLPVRVTPHIARGAAFVPFNQPGLAANTLLSGSFSTVAAL